MNAVRAVGEATLSGKNQVSLPALGIRLLGWQRGDRLIVETIGDDMMVLVRRPADWVEAYAGKLTDVFGTHDENLAFIQGERQSWGE